MPSFSALQLIIIAAAAALSSVGAAPPAPIGMPGCDTSCGDVDVPYPFGMGPARCYWGPGFNLTCDRKSNPPRLLLADGDSSNQLRLDEFDLDSSTVRAMNTGSIKIGGDGIGTFGGGLLRDNGPIRLRSSSDWETNELIVTGCNLQATLRNGNVTMASCSSLCDGRHYSEPELYMPNILGYRKQCSGRGCCQADIVINHEEVAAGKQRPVYNPSSYGVELRWLGLNSSRDQQWPPARVFVAEGGWFHINKLHFQTEDAMEVPVLLEWEVVVVAKDDDDTPTTSCPTDLGRTICKSNNSGCTKGTRGYSCSCDQGYDGNPYVPNGCQDVDECELLNHHSCYGECINTNGSYECRCPQGTHGDPSKYSGCVGPVTVTGANCSRSCGGMDVPYPFGMGPSHCYMPGFNLTCNTSHHGSPQLFLEGAGRVMNIYLENTTMRLVVDAPVADSKALTTFFPQGYTMTLDDGFMGTSDSGPYSLSTLNEIILTGCNVQATVMDYPGDRPPAANPTIISGCASFCCDNDTGRVPGGPAASGKSCYGRGCCQARISVDSSPDRVDFSWLDPQSPSDNMSYLFISEEGWFDKHYGGAHPGEPAWKFSKAAPPPQKVPVVLRWEVLQPGFAPTNLSSRLDCPAEVAARICKSEHSRCIPGQRGYSCQCSESYHGNPYVVDGCEGGPKKKPFKGLSVVIGVASGTGLVLLVLAAFFISSKLKYRRAQQVKRKFFKQNRGQLLQQLVSQRADIAEKMIISLEELQKATNNFDKDRELGGGGHGTVYKGILSDLHVVAIKKPKKVDQREIDEFINEVAILSQINHRNVVKLYGCCLETEVPMLVYEFISNGSLYQHLHVEGPRSMPWNDRLRIATEAAKSLAYLHSTTSVPIIHRDIKSANILLDDTLTAKVADFGASRYIAVEKSGLTTMVQGTIGYLDPVYSTTGRLTEKSDVYSYGVILVELMTRRKPFSYISSQGQGLAADFATLFKGGNLSQILDPQVMNEGGKEVEEVAALAVACVQSRGDDRPTMRHVELMLGSLQSSKKHILENAVVKEFKDNGVETNCTSIMSTKSTGESIRRYSMEEEFMLSARYPR